MTTLAIDWQALLASPEWAAQMLSPERMCDTRVEVINADGVHLADIYPDGGTVAFTSANTARFRGDLTMVADYPVDSTDLLHPFSRNRVRIWWREWLPALGGWGEVPLMTGHPEDPGAEKSPGLSWTLPLLDVMTEVLRGGYGGQSIDVSGMTTADAIDAFLTAIAPWVPSSIPATTTVLPSTYVLGSNRPGDDLAAICKPAGWTLCSDRMGVASIDPGDMPSALTADWSEGDGCPVTKLGRDVTTSEVVNAVMVRTTSSDIVPPLVGRRQDTDPASPTFIGRYGPYWSDDNTTDAATDQAGVDAVAEAIFEEKRRAMDAVQLEVPARPDLFARSLVALNSPDMGVAGTYRVESWRIPLPKGGEAPKPMTVVMANRSVS